MSMYRGVPALTRDEFEAALQTAHSVGVWVQVSPYWQMCLTITKEQAREIADSVYGPNGFKQKTIYGRHLISNNRLELSMNSQSLDRLEPLSPYLYLPRAPVPYRRPGETEIRYFHSTPQQTVEEAKAAANKIHEVNG